MTRRHSKVGERRGDTARDGSGMIGEQFLRGLGRMRKGQIQLPDTSVSILVGERKNIDKV